MAIFGNTSSEGSEDFKEHYIRGSWWVCPTDGIAKSINVWYAAQGANPNAKCALYEYIADNNAFNLLGVTEQKNLNYYGWAHFNLVIPVQVHATIKYFIVFWSDAASPIMLHYIQTANKGIEKSLTYTGIYPEHLDGETGTNKEFSMYCTYDEPVPYMGVTCESCTGYNNHGPEVTLFNWGDLVWVYLQWGPAEHDFYGETVGWKWIHNGVNIGENEFTITEHWYSIWWCFNDYPDEEGTGYIEIYHNGNLLGTSNIYAMSNQICLWIDMRGGPTGLDVTEVFQIIDSYIFQSPPAGGYIFIPTVTQVMGIIDYYLGFIASGNTKTGCNF